MVNTKNPKARYNEIMYGYKSHGGKLYNPVKYTNIEENHFVLCHFGKASKEA